MTLPTDFKKSRLVFYAFSPLNYQMIWILTITLYPVLLQRLGATAGQVGLLTAVGPLVMLLQLLWGSLSDRLVKRHQTRVPFLVVGTLLEVLGIFLMGTAVSLAQAALGFTLAWLGAGMFEGPNQAIMSDKIPAAWRHVATGYMALVRGVTLVVFIGSINFLTGVNPNLPYFLAISLILLGVALSIGGFISRTPNQPQDRDSSRFSWTAFNPRVLRFFLSHFFWAFGLQCVTIFAVLFVVYEIYDVVDINSLAGQLAVEKANLFLALIAISLLLFAPLITKVASHFDKTKAMYLAFATFLVACPLGMIVHSEIGAAVVCALFGFGFGAILILPFPILTEIQPVGFGGLFAGLYAVVYAVGQAPASTLVGFLIDRSGSYRVVFLVAGVAFLVSLFFFRRLAHLRDL